MKTMVSKTCPVCGNVFAIGLGIKQKTCSKECGTKLYSATRKEDRRCRECGEFFSCGKKSSRKFCSPSCVASSQRKRVSVVCALCGKAMEKIECLARTRLNFCCIEHAQEYRKKTRRKASNCVVCKKEMTGDDLRQFWGKGGRNKNGKIHGMCRECKNRIDAERREETERLRLKRIGPKKLRSCALCGAMQQKRHCNECVSNRAEEVIQSEKLINRVAAKKRYYEIMGDPEKKQKFYSERDQKIRSSPRKMVDKAIGCAMSADLNKRRSGQKAKRKWESLVGYTAEDLAKRLEKLFKPGMSWDNYGEWHIDHIIPKSKFNYETAEDPDFKRAWAITNLQPLWAEENLRKSASLSVPLQPSLSGIYT